MSGFAPTGGFPTGIGGGYDIEELSSGAFAFETLPDSVAYRILASQAFAGEELSLGGIASLSVSATATAGLFTAAELFNTLDSLASASESLKQVITAILADNATAAEAFDSIYKNFEHIRDFATATDVMLTSRTSAVAVLSTAVAMELMSQGFDGTLTSTAAGSEALMESLIGVAQLLVQASASDTLENNIRAVALLDDSAAADDDLTSQGEFLNVLISGADAAVIIKIGDTEYAAWVMNADNLATSQYQNFGFNSFAQLPDGYYGAREDGLYRLIGDTDAGVDILAWLKTGLMNFGTGSLKSVPMMYIGLTGDGDLLLTVIVTTPEGAKTEYTYRMVERTANATRENRVKIGKGLRSVYWQWELRNAAGSDFSVDTTRIWPMVLSRRIR